MSDLFFDNRKLPHARNEYVAFLDLMGTQNHMQRSVRDASNFIFKLHAAVVSAWRKSAYIGVFVYPIMDGVYITSSNKENIEKLLVKIFSDLAEIFIKESNPYHQFIPRCGLAYGEIIHGHNVPYNASRIFELDLQYKNNILLGQAMINAYTSEGEAAPFGIKLHNSAANRTTNGKSFGAFSENWVWYESTTIKVPTDISKQLGDSLSKYYSIVKDEHHVLHYPTEKIEKHESKAIEYFKLTNGDKV